jgi:hypothetical protein
MKKQRVCSKCGIFADFEAYKRNKALLGGREYRCSDCLKKKSIKSLYPDKIIASKTLFRKLSYEYGNEWAEKHLILDEEAV